MKGIEGETAEARDTEGATDRTDRADRRKMGSTTEATESTERRAPELSDEQREWLNRVFIPNFRAELMRTLELKGLLKDSGKRNGRGAKRKGRMNTGVGRADSKGASEDQTGGSALPGNVGARGDVDKSAVIGGDVDNPAQETQQELGQEDTTGAVAEAPERVTELESENRRLRSIVAEARVDGELVAAAARQQAINPSQVAHLLRQRVRLDGNLEPMVVDANGDRAYDGYGRPVTVADAVRAFLEGNPHLVRASTQLAGGGSGGSDATAMGRRVAAITGGDLIEEALREGA